MAFSVARMGYEFRTHFVHKENLHQLELAKFQARRDIDLRIQHKVREYEQTRLDVLARIRRKKDYTLAGWLIALQILVYISIFAFYL